MSAAEEWLSHDYSGFHPQLYYDKVWWVSKPDRVVVLHNKSDGLFYVTSDDFSDSPENDIGPYPTLEEAQTAAVVLHRMGAGPK